MFILWKHLSRQFQHGYFWMEALLCLYFASLFLVILLPLFKFLQHVEYPIQQIQNEIATIQLRRILATSYQPIIHDECLLFIQNGQQRQLCLVEHHVLLQPGTQYMYTNVEDMGFMMEGELKIWLIQEGKRNEYTIQTRMD